MSLVQEKAASFIGCNLINELMEVVVPDEIVLNKIYYLRNQKVMLDSDLAELYGVGTKAVNQAVARNFRRFPDDFMPACR